MYRPIVWTTVAPSVSYVKGTYDVDETVMLTVEVAGVVYTSGIDDELELRSNGVWSLSMPIALDDGYYDVKVAATSAVGDVLTDNTTNELGIGVPQIKFKFSGDYLWSAPELEREILISGTTQDVEDGQVVTVTITDTQGSTSIGTAQVNNNAWVVPVNTIGQTAFEGDVASVSELFLEGGLLAEAIVEDARGYSASVTQDITIDLLAELTLDLGPDGTPPIISDGLDALVISGATVDVEQSKKVEITLTDVLGNTVDGYNYTNASGLWSQSFDVSSFADGAVTIDAYVRDSAGNRAEISETAFVLDQPITLTLNSGVINAETLGIGGGIFGGSLNADDQQLNITITDELGSQFIMNTDGDGDSWGIRIDGVVNTKMYGLSSTGLVDGGWLISESSGFQRFSATGERLSVSEFDHPSSYGAQVLGLPDGGWIATYITKDSAPTGDKVQVGPLAHVGYISVDLYVESYAVVQERFDASGNLLDSQVIHETPQGVATFLGPYAGYYPYQPSQPLENLQISEDVAGGWEASWYNTHTEKTLSLGFDAAGNAAPEGPVEVAHLEPASLTIELTDGGWLTFNDDYSFYQRFNADGSAYLYGDVAGISDLADGLLNVEVTVTDAETGETASTSKEVVLDRVAELTVDPLGIIGESESSAVTISGTAIGIEDGQSIKFWGTNTNLFTTIEDGLWSITHDFSGYSDGSIPISAEVSDLAGNKVWSRFEFILDQVALTQAPTVTPKAIANPTSGVIQGTYDYLATDNLTVTVNGVTHTLGEEGSKLTSKGYARWTLSAPDEGWQEGVYDVVVTTVDANGYTLTDNTINEFIVDLTAPDRPTVNPIDTTNTHPWLSGYFDSEDSAIFTVTVDGQTYTLGEDDNLFQHANNDNVWVLRPVGNYSFGTHDVVAISTDIVGRVKADNTTGELTITQTASISIEVGDNLTGFDGNATSLTLGGLVDGVEEGQTVTVTFSDTNGDFYQYTTPVISLFPVFGVHAYGFYLSLTETELNQLHLLEQGPLTIAASVTNLGGSTAEDTLSVPEGFDVFAGVDIDETTALSDGVIDQHEIGDFMLSGITESVNDGQMVSIEIMDEGGNTVNLLAQVNDGSWEVTATELDAFPENLVVSNLYALPDGSWIEVEIGETVVYKKYAADGTLENTVSVDMISATTVIPEVGQPVALGVVTAETIALDILANGHVVVYWSEGTGEDARYFKTEFDRFGELVSTPIDLTDLQQGTLQISANVFDVFGNEGNDSVSVELDLGFATPTVNSVTTANTHTWLSGTFDSDGTVALTVAVDGKTYTLGDDANLFQHANNSDIWVLRPVGLYHLGEHNVVVTATNATGNVITDSTTGELTISRDMFAPSVNAAKQTLNTMPSVGGRYDEAATETLTVTVGGVTYTLGEDSELLNHGANRWVLHFSSPLADGVYDVQVSTTNATGATLMDSSVGELTVGMLAPTVSELDATNRKPWINGMFDSTYTESLTVEVAGNTYTLGVDSELSVHANNDNLWVLRPSTALAYGVYDITVTATDSSGSGKTDSTADEVNVYQSLVDTTHGDTLITQGGNDRISISDDTFVQIDGGAGIDTLTLAGEGMVLDFSLIDNVEIVDMGTGDAGNSLSITAADVLAVEHSTLTIMGDSNDSLTSQAQGWIASGTQAIDGSVYNSYEAGGATLLVEQGIVAVIS